MQLNTKNMMHFVRTFFGYACLRRLVAIKEVQNYRKIVYITNFFENGWWKDAYPSSYHPGSAPGHKLQKPSKECGLQSLGTISFVLLYL